MTETEPSVNDVHLHAPSVTVNSVHTCLHMAIAICQFANLPLFMQRSKCCKMLGAICAWTGLSLSWSALVGPDQHSRNPTSREGEKTKTDQQNLFLKLTKKNPKLCGQKAYRLAR